MSDIEYSGPFIKKFYSATYAGGRGADNPASGTAFNETVPVGQKRVYLLLQNSTAGEITVTFGDSNGIGIVLYPGQSATFDNFNTAFTSSSGSLKVFEAFN
jgi:hypothetical protein